MNNEQELKELRIENAKLKAILSAMKAYLAGEPSNPPVTGMKKTILGQPKSE